LVDEVEVTEQKPTESGQDDLPTLEPKRVPGHSHDGTPKIYKLLAPAISVITGESGAGKSMFAMWLAWNFINPPCGHKECRRGHVFSNIIVARREPDGTWNDRAHPERYHYVESWAEFFTKLSEVLLKDPDAPCLLVVDESALPNVFSAYSWTSEAAQILRATGTLKRKWNLHILVIALRHSLILKSIREMGEEGGILDIKFMKDRWAVEKYGSHLLDEGYDPREIVIISRPELEEPEAFTFTFAEQLAKPPEMAKPGDYVYATLAQATWGLGKHPYTEKGTWSWQQFIAIQSGVWPDKIPKLMYDFWHGNPNKLLASASSSVPEQEMPTSSSAPKQEVSVPEAPDVVAPRPANERMLVVETPRISTQKGGIVREVERLLIERGRDTNLSQIGRECGVSQQFVTQVKKRLIEEGKI